MIKQAIIPLAGLGTRLLPLTSVFPKELLPINGKPGIEYILDECIDAGIKEVIFIISNKKKMIKTYFYNDNFYKKIIKLMLLPDDLIIKRNCSKSMIKIHKKYNASVMASMNVKKNNVSRWGIYKLKTKINKNNYLISDVIEKPSVKKAPSNKAVIGRYILPREIFSKLLKQKPGKGGEK